MPRPKIRNNHQAVVIFVKDQNESHSNLDPEAETFAFSYSRVIEASEFCKREQLKHIFIGYKNGQWVLDVDDFEFDYSIKITPKGISPDVEEKYIYIIEEFKSPGSP